MEIELMGCLGRGFMRMMMSSSSSSSDCGSSVVWIAHGGLIFFSVVEGKGERDNLMKSTLASYLAIYGFLSSSSSVCIVSW